MPRGESANKWIDRNRAPRVHLSYDVEDGGALRKIELPFVMGVMAGLSGDRAEPLPEVADRTFDEVDVDNFDSYLKKQAPRVEFNTENALEGEGQIGIDLTFERMSDFLPDEVAKNVGSEIENIVLTKTGDDAYEVTQEGPISEKLGAQVSSPAEITAESVAAKLGVDATHVSVGPVTPDLRDNTRFTVRVTRKGPLAILLEARNALSELISRADGKRGAEAMLERIMTDPELQKLLSQGGGGSPSGE